MEPRTPKSIHELPPLETGGIEARRGFSIQDHVAVALSLELLDNVRLKEVWCENQDDVTLIWNNNEQDEVEFVQVKGNEFDQLWSIAKLCERKKKNGQDVIGSSILERSLAYDRCCEATSFRMVTTRPVKDELKPLTYSISSQTRISLQGDIDRLILSIGNRLGNFKSENNNGHDYWTTHTVWKEIHSFDSVKNANLLKLANLVEAQGDYLFVDQLEELHEKLLTRVYDAALIRWHDNDEGKKFKKSDCTKWFANQLQKMIHPIAPGGGAVVRDKMARALIPQDTIDTANAQRRRYRKEILRPQYLKSHDMRLTEGEVIATLQDLRSQLDAGSITDSGVEFHSRCLQRLSELRDQLPISPSPPLVFLQGCMYNIVDRCLHRFVRIDI